MASGEAASCAKRLQNELLQLMVCRRENKNQMNDVDGVSAFPDGDNFLTWTATIAGPKGTEYDGLVYNLSLVFPENYPYAAPEVKVDTRCITP